MSIIYLTAFAEKWRKFKTKNKTTSGWDTNPLIVVFVGDYHKLLLGEDPKNGHFAWLLPLGLGPPPTLLRAPFSIHSLPYLFFCKSIWYLTQMGPQNGFKKTLLHSRPPAPLWQKSWNNFNPLPKMNIEELQRAARLMKSLPDSSVAG